MAKYKSSGAQAKFLKEAAAAESSSGGKKVKDPNAPKRPLSAFMFFAKTERTKIAGMCGVLCGVVGCRVV